MVSSMRRSQTLRSAHAVAAIALAVALATAATSGRAEVVWVWSGAVTSGSAVVKARVSPGAERVRLWLGDAPNLEEARELPSGGPGVPGPDGIVAFALEGLQPDTTYHYALEVDGRRDERKLGRFHTFPLGPASFRIAFGSCARTGSSHRIFDTIRRLEPLLFVHMGDFHYESIPDGDRGRFSRAFDEVLTSARQSALYRSAPIAYMWDDHDYGPNDADRTSESRNAALWAYDRHVPHYPLTDGAEGTVETIQQAFDVGRVHFVLTDVRAGRDPVDEPDGPGKTVLGESQRRWLLEQLESAAARDGLLVWVDPVPWITRAAPGSAHGWEPYGSERRLIADRIEALGLTHRMLMLSGDAHMVAIDDGSHSNYAGGREGGPGGFPVMHAAPLDRYPRPKGGPYSHGFVARKRLFGVLQEKQFGLMDLRDDGSTIRVRLTGHSSTGRQLKGMRLDLECAPECRVVEETE
jgi:phosphodiesterase/alkaline phosphatase D-like protein